MFQKMEKLGKNTSLDALQSRLAMVFGSDGMGTHEGACDRGNVVSNAIRFSLVTQQRSTALASWGQM